MYFSFNRKCLVILLMSLSIILGILMAMFFKPVYDVKEVNESYSVAIKPNDLQQSMAKLDLLADSVMFIHNNKPFTFIDINPTIEMYATTTLNVREKPSTDSSIISVLTKNQKLQVTGSCDEIGWYRISLPSDVDGYVSAEYISDEPIEIVQQSISSNQDESVLQEPIEINEQDVQPIPQTFVQGEPGVSSNMISSVESYYNRLPENLRTCFQSLGWHITISSSSLGPRYGYNYSILALTVYGEHQIWIDNRSSAASAIVHEMGHFVDNISGTLSNSPDFVNIYNVEHDAFCAYHSTHENNTSTSLEYFAEAFQQCIFDPSGMSATCPQTYNYIMSIVNSL